MQRHARRSIGVVVVAAAALSFGAFPGAPGAPAGAAVSAGPATTTVSEVRGLHLADATGMLTYQVRHDITAAVDPGTALPGARVSRRAHHDAFRGLYVDGGYESVWTAPAGQLEFEPYSNLYQSAYFLDDVAASDSVALHAGDHADLAVANLAFDAPLAWDAPRQTVPTGTLGWDAGTDFRTVSGSYGGVDGQTDVVFVRADILAVGGDVDARARAISTAPLTIDLPRTYPATAQGGYTVSTFYPTAQYIASMTMRVQPQAGKATLVASVRGYIPQARTYELSGGRHILQWHLPIWGFITVTPGGSGLDPVRAVGMPSGGLAVVGDGRTTRTLSVAPGERLVAGPGIDPKVLAGAAGRTTTSEPAPRSAGEPWLVSELRTTSKITASLDAPVHVRVANGRYSLTLDPDYRGQGVLALSAVRLGGAGPELAQVMAVPYAIVNGAPVALTRARLRDLRVTPEYPWITIGFEGWGGPWASAQWGSAYLPGLVVEAVYSLGHRTYAFIGYQAAPPTPGDDWRIRSRVVVRSLDPGIVDAALVQYLELPEAGPVTYDGQARTTEFQAPLDPMGSVTTMTTSAHSLTGTVGATGTDAQVTVLAAPAPLTPDPHPDPTVSLDDGPVALYYTQPPGAPPRAYGYSVLVSALSPSPAAPAPNPRPLGATCGAAEISDGPAPDAAPAQDVESAWFDADGANVYATLVVRDLPAQAPQGSVYSWAVHFRFEHQTFFARAILDDGGAWAFQFGPHNLDSPVPGYQKTADIGGDVRTGTDGLIRLWIPRELVGVRGGELLRDSSARALVESSGVLSEADQAPDGANGVFGTGNDYRVNECA